MELTSSEAVPEDFYFDPIEYVFDDDGQEWAVAFIATVPHYSEAETLHGDLFNQRLRDIDDETLPIIKGSPPERQIIDKLQSFADLHHSREQQSSLRDDKFPRMTKEMATWRSLLWFISALERRSASDTN